MKRTGAKKIVIFMGVCLLIGLLCLNVFAQGETGAKILTQQLLLGDDLTMVFTVQVDEQYRQSASISAAWAGQKKIYPLSAMTPDPEGSYVVSVELSAAQMTESISLTVSAADSVLTRGTYSIRDYAVSILEGQYTDETKQMVKKTLHYGAKAQLYFDYLTESLADEGYEIENSALLPENVAPASVTGRVSGVRFYGASLVTRNQLAVRYYFNTSSLQGLQFTANGQSCQPVYANGRYYVEIGNINPQMLDKTGTVSVTDGSNTLTVTYSPLNYIERMYEKSESSDSLKALLKGLYAYHLEAKAFTGLQEHRQVTIRECVLTGAWVNDRMSQSSLGPKKSFDRNTTSLWNPQAQSQYKGEPGIIYTLDGWYTLESVSMQYYKAEDMYFDLYGSADGVHFQLLAQVNGQNASQFYTDAVCTVEVDTEPVRYVKIIFTGRNGNGTWVNFYEISATGKKVSTPVIQAAVIYGHTAGGWSQTGNPMASYDESLETVWEATATDFVSDEAVVYTLNGAYDLQELKLSFAETTYFDLFVSSDGASYTLAAQVTRQNADQYYQSGDCLLEDLNASQVRYIKLVFTGCAENYLSLFE